MADDLTMFDSTNPYQNIEAITARTPDELTSMIKAIRTPIKIVSVVSHNNRFTAFIIGDIRKKRGRPSKASEE